jgi:class 3 adenylate cyclase/tetratricopeptide (TPR) repeat protein
MRSPRLDLVICPNCAKDVPGEFPFCPFCGTPLAAEETTSRAERKVVTVLFADLVGFTGRAEALDPEDVHAFLTPYHAHLRAELERYGGTVEKFIGDAAMALFGAPVAHEDDPERAVRAALAIRDWAVDQGDGLQVRIAVNTGEALVTLDARPGEGEGMAAGDVVNTAARLQTAAPLNGILVGEQTYRSTVHTIDYREAEPVVAKGKSEPVLAWQAMQARSRLGADMAERALSPLVGRSRELDLLVSTMERVRDQSSPQLITLVGVPGIGKSRLVYELFRTVEEHPEFIRWRQGRSLPYGEGVSFWALAEIVRAQAGMLETDTAEELAEKLHRAVEELGLELAEAQWVERHLRPLAGLSEEGDASREERFTAWRRFLEGLAGDRLLVLVFEDLHWADDALLDFVDHLVDWARGVPLLVLGTARPELLERRPSWGGGKPNATTLSLAPISDAETAELVRSLVSGTTELSTQTHSDLLVRAGGNPLYAEEFARLVADGRSTDDLPEGVQGLIAARLDALPSSEKELLQGAAVVGKVFWLGAASAIAEAPRWTAGEQLHALERKEFVRRDRRSTVAGEEQYAFWHALVREVAYGQIPRVRRVQHHRSAADWIESLGRPDDHAEMLAHHYLSALELARSTGEADEELLERARTAALSAGRRAMAFDSFPAAARFYSKAFELTGEADPEWPELLLQLGSALHYTDDPRGEQMLYDAAEALVAAGRPERAADAHTLLTEVLWDRGSTQRGYEELLRAYELVGTRETASRARVLARLARTKMLADDNEEALELAKEAVALAERLGLDGVRVHALNTRGSSRWSLGDAAGGIEDFERCIDLALASGSHLIAVAYNNLGTHLLYAGDVRRDAQLREDALRAGERFGDERIVRFVRGVLPARDYYPGRWHEAEAKADAYIAECEASPHYQETASHTIRAMIMLGRGDAELASRESERALELAREIRDPQMLLPALATGVRVELELDRLQSAAGFAAEILAQKPAMGWMPPSIELAWAAQQVGITEAVAKWIEAIPFASTWNDAARAILAGDYAEAADIFFQIGSLPDEARARQKAGEDGDRVQVERALEFYRSVGATRYVQQCEALLGASA